ncbi:MAG: deoxyribodipyrimidine photo-lyase [Anaerolineales bacterium]|nr:MAG: deoxyribodipyrimidine photo-lyase [Anaerolineales bacterium]
MTTAIWWVRRDLRLADNHALVSALASSERVIPVFILDAALLDSPYASVKRIDFLFDGLRQLDAGLQARGSRLILRQGDALSVLRELVAETGANALFAEQDFSTYARHRDTRVAEALPLHLTGGLTVYPPGAVLKVDGRPYTVFTPFSRAWKTLPLPSENDIIAAPVSLPVVPDIPGLPLPESFAHSTPAYFPAGEGEAQRRLGDFVADQEDCIFDYSEGRNRLDQDGTSKLSPYLRLGMVSAQQAVVSALRAVNSATNARQRESAETWLNELLWREFYIHILFHFPQVRGSSFRPAYDQIIWENRAEDFVAWCEGRTGYPIVDAAMRQMLATGWMHNRARMITASFLVKDLLVDWRWGEKYFMQHLVDGDPAANNGGWQWTAGTGTDAAPYFRIFNPILQGKKYDPDGIYTRNWLPELVRVPDRYLHTPWEMPLNVQREVNCVIGDHYPAPIVDHILARKRTLTAYARARESAR